MRPAAVFANACWMAAALPERRRFEVALRRPRETQSAILARYLSRAASTDAGRRFGFDSIRSVEEYQARVPLVSYDDIRSDTARIAAGAQRVLTADPVVRLMPSSGSTAAAKLIPFTPALSAEFGRAVDAWASALFMTFPGASRGPAYWAISPPAGFGRDFPTTTVPIGFDSDAMYLGGLRQRLAEMVMAVKAGAGRIADVDVFLYASARLLAEERDLRLVSVWHPSFLGRLLETIDADRDRIADDIARGTISPPAAGPTKEIQSLCRRLRPRPTRADAVRCALSPRELWPSLAVVSCWADGPSRGAASQLSSRLDGVPIQPKGLLATEGVVSIPFGGMHPLAIRSHFLEFVGADGRTHLADDLVDRGEYDVVLTTGGGLYRYRLGDRVRVDGFVENTPSVEFVSRCDRVSDLFGEKLSEGFVAGVLEDLLATRPPFALVAPERTPDGVAYALFVESSAGTIGEIADRFERLLRRNPHYAWCVDLGQLRPARVVRVIGDGNRAYVDAHAARGQRLGDIKPSVLSTDMDWRSKLPCTAHTALSLRE